MWILLAVFFGILNGVVPRTLRGAVALLLLGPVLWLAAEALLHGYIHVLVRLGPVRALRNWLDERTYGRSFSWLRVGVLLLAVVMFGAQAGVVVWAVWAIARLWPPLAHGIGSIASFIEQNFF